MLGVEVLRCGVCEERGGATAVAAAAERFSWGWELPECCVVWGWSCKRAAS